MKVGVIKDEYWPFYILKDEWDVSRSMWSLGFDYIVEISPELFREYQLAVGSLEVAHCKIREAIKMSCPD